MMNLASLHRRLQPGIDEAIHNVIEQSCFIRGKYVSQFESELAQYLGCKSVIGCGNGTDALYLALRALNLSAGDEVITTTMSFVAAAEVIAELGLRPVFADVTADTYNTDIENIEKAFTPRVKAIVVTHLFGRPCNMQAIMDFARSKGLPVVEDAAQCMGGAAIVDGREQKLGTIGTVGCTSFFPSKNLGCMGDGGAVITNDDAVAQQVRMLANHGSYVKYKHEAFGVNSRLDGLQAAVLSVKLRHLDDCNLRRRQAAQRYTGKLAACANVVPPADCQGHVYHQYTIRVTNGRRDALKDFLLANGVKTMIYYTLMLHLQPAYSQFANGKLPVAESLQNEVISLPIDSEITDNDIDTICNLIREWDRQN